MGEVPPPLLAAPEGEDSTGPTAGMSAPEEEPTVHPFAWSSMDLPGMDPDEEYD